MSGYLRDIIWRKCMNLRSKISIYKTCVRSMPLKRERKQASSNVYEEQIRSLKCITGNILPVIEFAISARFKMT